MDLLTIAPREKPFSGGRHGRGGQKSDSRACSASASCCTAVCSPDFRLSMECINIIELLHFASVNSQQTTWVARLLGRGTPQCRPFVFEQRKISRRRNVSTRTRPATRPTKKICQAPLPLLPAKCFEETAPARLLLKRERPGSARASAETLLLGSSMVSMVVMNG